MTGHDWHDTMIAALLATAVCAELLCCAGMMAMRHSLDRLHYASAAVILGPLPLAAAIIMEEGLSSSGAQTMLTVLLVVLMGSVITHATANAIRRARSRSGRPELAP